MPRVTRNFWISAAIDGRSTTLEGGPQGRNGEFELTVYIRDNGSVLRAVRLSGHAHNDGTLAITASAAGDVAQSMTGHIEPGSAGFTVTTQAGYAKPRPEPRRTPSAALTRELLRTPPPLPEPEPVPPCPYLANDVPTREECAVSGCEPCRQVIENEAERATADLRGTDPFGHPYA